jgi:hypothetical protein
MWCPKKPGPAHGSVTVRRGFFLCFDIGLRIGLRGMFLSFLHAQHTSQLKDLWPFWAPPEAAHASSR